MEIRLSIDGLTELQALWRQAPELVQEELLKATGEAELLLQGQIQEKTPVGANGLLRKSILAREPEVLSHNVLGAVGTSIAHAVPVELGTKPHWAPLRPLIDWVQAKLDINGREAVGVAMKIQRKIAARGTPAVGMFHRGFNENRGQVNEMYQRAHGRMVQRLGTLG